LSKYPNALQYADILGVKGTQSIYNHTQDNRIDSRFSNLVHNTTPHDEFLIVEQNRLCLSYILLPLKNTHDPP